MAATLDPLQLRTDVLRYWREHKSKDAPGQRPLFESPRHAGGKIGQDMDSTRQWTAEDSAQHPRDNTGQFRQKPGGDPNQGQLFNQAGEAKPDALGVDPDDVGKNLAVPEAKERGFDVQKGLLDEPEATAAPPAKPPAPHPEPSHIDEVRRASPPGAIALFRVGDEYKAFGDDAAKLAKHTGQTGDSFPAAELETHLTTMVGAGQRVAIAEMVKPGETPHAKADVEKVKAVKQRHSPKVEKAIEQAAATLAGQKTDEPQPGPTKSPAAKEPWQTTVRDMENGAHIPPELWHGLPSGNDPESGLFVDVKRNESGLYDVALQSKRHPHLRSPYATNVDADAARDAAWRAAGFSPQNFPSAMATIIDNQRRHIVDALASGKSVPTTVLADYPDLVRSVAAQPPSKQPWQMTRKEFIRANHAELNAVQKRMGLPQEKLKRADLNRTDDVQHRAAVEKAFAAGEPVPPEVLAEYPHLAKKPEEQPATVGHSPKVRAAIEQAHKTLGVDDRIPGGKADAKAPEEQPGHSQQPAAPLDAKYAAYVESMKASGIAPRGKDEWTASVQAKQGKQQPVAHSPKIQAAIDETAFALSAAPTKPAHKPAEFESSSGKQKKLLSGLDALPGQMDLIGDLDKQGDDAPQQVEVPQQAEPEPHSPAIQSAISEAASSIAATARESAIDSGASPREAAEQSAAAQASQYEFARESAIPNAGEDLKGAARHKVNAWRSLEQAEADGTAEQLVRRDLLLKAEPPDLLRHAERNPLTALAMHLAMRRFPAQPGYGTARRRSKIDEGTAKKDRAQYVEAYRELKAIAERLAATENDPLAAFEQFRQKAQELSRKYRGSYAQSGYMANLGTDQYNNTANSLVALSAAVTTRGRELSKSTNLVRSMNDFAAKFAAAHPELPASGKQSRVARYVQDIMEGTKSMAAVFGQTGTDAAKKKGFDPAEMYGAEPIRRGGSDISSQTSMPTKATDYMLSHIGLRGVQWGNYVTDAEREHHARKAAESLTDLADILQLDPHAIALDGKLGLAIGARGTGTALAHYEPTTQVINLTRTGGVGSLAHEWGHAFDHMLVDYKISGRLDRGPAADFQSDRVSPKRLRLDEKGQVVVDEKRRALSDDMTNDPIWSTFDALRKSWMSSGFRKRLGETVSQMIRDGLISKQKRSYWTSNEEMFARTFERYIQRKLAANGRANTYLAGIESKAYKEGGLWPTDQEVDAMMPAFDGIFAAYRTQRGSQPQKYTRSQLTAYFMRYLRQPARRELTPAGGLG